MVEGELAELREAAGAPEGPAREAAVETEVGDVLFSVVNLARKLGADPELALRSAAARFASRVAAVEGLAAEQGLDHAALAALEPGAADRLWQEAKRRSGTGA